MIADAQRPQCQATRRDGRPCTALAVGESAFCVGHRPGAREARAKGGQQHGNVARALKLLPSRLQPVAVQLETALAEVHAGTLKPSAAGAMAALATALVRVVQAGELEERTRAVERRLAELEQAG